MSKLKGIFGIVGNVVKWIALISILGMNLFLGYIVLAPDSFPKPLYINYRTMVLLAPLEGTETAGSGEAEGEAEVSPEELHPGDGLMVDTGTKIVNLADPGGRRYLKTTITIEVAPPAGLATHSEEEAAAGGHEGAAATEDPVLTAFNDTMTANMPVINDTLTTLLSSKTFEGIYTIDGKEALRVEIQETLNERLPELHVIAVYFTEFIVQ
jgi:flagellar FliL protein